MPLADRASTAIGRQTRAGAASSSPPTCLDPGNRRSQTTARLVIVKDCIRLISLLCVVIGAILMRPTCAILFFFSLAMLPALHAERIDNRNFAIDTCFPTANAIQLAEGRARVYWAKHAARFGPEPRFLAVETSKVFPGEVHDLWPKLINSETTASFFSYGDKTNTYSNLQLLGIMIFDTRTGRFVSNQGYISVDTPPRGSVARFGSYVARYIGWG